MAGVRLSIIVPTLGRPSLARTLASCAEADELVVVLDTAKGARGLPCTLPANAVYAEGNFGVTGGHAGRVHGIGMATGSHLAFFDDDDEYLPGAIDLMREAACDVPVIFRMDDPLHGVIWKEPEIKWANVSTQMYLVPNIPSKLGSWTPHMPGWPCPGGDFTFIKETVENFPGVIWREEVISVIRPDKTISIVTPWQDHPELWDDYYEAVSARRSTDTVTIIDNGSDPPLPFGIPVRENLGFVGGCNAGLKVVTGDVVLFLNNDIKVLRSHWLEEIREAVEPGVLAGPLRFDNHSRVDDQSLPYIDGWCLAGMRDDLLELGGFDEGLVEPAYYSDNLLCLEARAAGMTLRDVRVGLTHKENITAGPAQDPRVQVASLANREKYVARARELLVAA